MAEVRICFGQFFRNLHERFAFWQKVISANFIFFQLQNLMGFLQRGCVVFNSTKIEPRSYKLSCYLIFIKFRTFLCFRLFNNETSENEAYLFERRMWRVSRCNAVAGEWFIHFVVTVSRGTTVFNQRKCSHGRYIKFVRFVSENTKHPICICLDVDYAIMPVTLRWNRINNVGHDRRKM